MPSVLFARLKSEGAVRLGCHLKLDPKVKVKVLLRNSFTRAVVLQVIKKCLRYAFG